LVTKTDPDGKAVVNTYNDRRLVATKAWARLLSGSTHVTASYSYAANTADLTSKTYNDSGVTHEVDYTYNRLGQPATVADATGTRTLNYNLSGTLELQSEDLDGTFYSGHTRITYGYDSHGRSNALKLGTSGTPNADQDIAYTYDSAGRLGTVAAASETFTYGYVSNASLIGTVTATRSGYTTVTDTRTYQSQHDWLDTRTGTYGTAPAITSFDYTPDELGRATGVLADPQLSVFDGGTSIASNNDWSSSLSTTFTALGAFALNAGSKDAALVVTLQAGKPYSVQVSGVGGTTGEALVEIYLMP
jgi:YD repeat-containing protein